MKKPFTLCFSQASIPLRQVARRPFVPACAMPFADGQHCHYFVGDGCQLAYRWHDAFDVYVAVLEARLAAGLSIPVGSHLPDLYLVYQLQGESRFVRQGRHRTHAQTVGLSGGQRVEVYTPPARAVLELRPGKHPDGYTLAAIVPKSGWVTRHPPEADSPMENLILLLKQRYAAHRYLKPAPITPAMHAWLHMLLTTPPNPGMLLDDALNTPMVRLVEEHREDYLRSEQENQNQQLADAGRLLAAQMTARMDGHRLVSVDDVASALGVSPYDLWRAHSAVYLTPFAQYIDDVRMEYAKSWLAQAKTVKEVGLALGYSTANNFSRSFKKKYGISPGKYRNQK